MFSAWLLPLFSFQAAQIRAQPFFCQRHDCFYPNGPGCGRPTLFRQGLLALLREQCPELLVTLTADISQVADLAVQHKFALMVLDGALPGLDLSALLERLHRVRPTQRLLVLADPRTLAQRREALAWPGTRLLLPSYVPPQALAAALAPWLAPPSGDAPAAARGNSPYLVAGHSGHFSRRELEVLRLVVEDHCNEEIANRLCLSVRTVESHRRTLLQKAGTRTLVGLAAHAVREGWVA